MSANGTYESFLAAKDVAVAPAGFERVPELGAHLFPFQRDLVGWALRRGRAALFCDTGLGKTVQQLEWARHVVAHTGGRVLILAPLAVAAQTKREGAKFGVEVRQCREPWEVGDGINVTNYDRLARFDPRDFDGIVLDESSVLKDFTSSTRTAIIEAFRSTPYRLACSATPAPNDFTELGNHAEFLGVMSRTEMLATWFIHDGGSTQDWRLKGHAERDFWRWVCSWAALVRRPSDLGYEDGAFALPPLQVLDVVVDSDIMTARRQGQLFVEPAKTLSEQRDARRASLADRVAACAEIVNASTGPFLVWCELNNEGDALTEAIHGAVQIAGSDDPEVKERRMVDFSEGRTRVLVTKPSIAGYGMNWQHCAQMAFVGISHSYEQFYQAVRRCWRFGQNSPVTVHVITSEAEGAVGANLRRKEQDAARMAAEMSRFTVEITRQNVNSSHRETEVYRPTLPMRVPSWLKEERA
jgi:superfamily II DNA or RNA helicase